MKKLTKFKIAPGTYIYVMVAAMLVLTGCNSGANNNNSSYQEGFNHILEDNTYGYYCDVFLLNDKQSPRDGTLLMSTPDEEICVEIENTGQDRQFAMQVFVDYVQANIQIDEIDYKTFFLDAKAGYSGIVSFTILDDIDTSKNHKLLVALTAGADVLTKEADFSLSDNYALVLDQIMLFNSNNEMAVPLYSHTNTNQVDGGYEGLILNTDFTTTEHKLPDRTISVLSGRPFEVNFHVGGYNDSDTVLFLVSLGMEQVTISGQKYILCYAPDASVVQGTITLTAPDKAGSYELTGFVIKNPFENHVDEWIPSDMAYRFTVDVSQTIE